MQEIEENYFIDVDLSEDDKRSSVMVYRGVGSTVKMVNSFTGTEARLLHDILCGKKKLKGDD